MFCRTRRPGRFFCRGMRIRRAGYGPHRRPAGDKRIGHHPTGRVRRCFTIEKASPPAEKGEPYDGPGDLGCSEAPSSGLSSPWQALRGRVAMPRRSLLVIYLGNPKIPKEPRRRFSISTAGQREPLRLMERQHVERITWARLFLRPSPRITNCNAAGGSSEIRPILSPGVLVVRGNFRHLRGQIWAI